MGEDIDYTKYMNDMSYEEAFKKYGLPLDNKPKKVDMGELVLQEDGTYSATN